MSTFYLVKQSEGIVRPGTSDALTARAIDATVHPVVQARDAVAEVPGLVDSMPPSLIGGTLGLSAVLLMIASQHGRHRMALAPVLMSGLLLLPVSNYHAAANPSGKPAAEAAVVEKKESSGEPAWLRRFPREEKRESPPDEPRSLPRVSFPDFNVPDFEVSVPPELIEEALPLIEMVVPEDWDRDDVRRFLRRNSERLRREVRRLRQQQRIEARQRTYSMEHHHHRHSR